MTPTHASDDRAVEPSERGPEAEAAPGAVGLDVGRAPIRRDRREPRVARPGHHRLAQGASRTQAAALGQDLRYASRALRRSPGFTLTAMRVLALGSGASTAIFSAGDHVLVSRLPYPNDDRLVRIYQQNSPTNRFGLSAVDYNAIIAQQRSFSAVGAVRWNEATIAARMIRMKAMGRA